jgi:atypical dual specificity phosphatase
MPDQKMEPLAHVVDWLLPGRLAASVNPSVGQQAAAQLRAAGVRLLINLHERPDPPELLYGLGARALHLPVPSSEPPTPEQIEQGVAAIRGALDDGIPVAVHCAAGLGRTGTLLAAYLVSQGASPAEAIDLLRALRPGSVETLEQEQAVRDFARRTADAGGPSGRSPAWLSERPGVVGFSSATIVGGHHVVQADRRPSPVESLASGDQQASRESARARMDAEAGLD